MIQFICSTCEGKFEALITPKGLVYLIETHRIMLTDENEDCSNCKEELDIKLKQATEQARAEMKSRKKHITL